VPCWNGYPRGVRLTAAGKAFATEARGAVTHAASARRNARAVLGLEAGELEVATVTSVAFGGTAVSVQNVARAISRHDDGASRVHPPQRPSTMPSAWVSATSPSDPAPRTGAAPSLIWDGRNSSLCFRRRTRWRKRGARCRSKTSPIVTGCSSDQATALSALILDRGARAAGFTPRRTVQTAQVAAAGPLAAAGPRRHDHPQQRGPARPRRRHP